MSLGFVIVTSDVEIELQAFNYVVGFHTYIYQSDVTRVHSIPKSKSKLLFCPFPE